MISYHIILYQLIINIYNIHILIKGSSSTCGSSGVNLYSTYCGLLLSTDGASATTAASNIPICGMKKGNTL